VKKTIRTSIFFAIPFTVILICLGPIIFKWYLGEKWEIAGVYAQYLTPMLFLYFILSPISGLPILLKKQKQSFFFSLIGTSFTIVAFFIGIWLKMPFIQTLLIYSTAYTLFYLFTLLWFFNLIQKSNESIS